MGGIFNEQVTKDKIPNAYAHLFVHLGKENQEALSQKLLDKVFAALNIKTELAVIQGKWDSDFWIEWSKWMDNKGIFACSNEQTVNILSKMVKFFEPGHQKN